jgi:hypothetical protein
VGVAARIVAVAFGLCCLLAVGGAQAQEKAAEPAPAKAKVVGPPEVPWKDMTVAQKNRFMKAVVHPKMRATFQKFDRKEFRTFTCETCHGKDPKARDYKMPGPDVPALPGTPEAFQAAMKEKPTWPKLAKFMSEQVTPQMAGLLGLPAFDPKKPEAGGFSCHNCHTIQKPN